MIRRRLRWFGPTAFAAVLSLPLTVAAQAPTCTSPHGPGIGILPPTESPDKPSHHPKPLFIPYYSPLTPISSRWRPVQFVPYYRGYCAGHTRVDPHRGVPYGNGGVFGTSAGNCQAGLADGSYGIYSGAPQDEARLLHLGGAGSPP
jgi:hypothetical protein